MDTPVIIHSLQNHCMGQFHQVGPLDPSSARPLAAIGCWTSLTCRRFLAAGVIVQAKGDRYYIDPTAETRFRTRRLKATITLAAAGLLAVLVPATPSGVAADYVSGKRIHASRQVPQLPHPPARG